MQKNARDSPVTQTQNEEICIGKKFEKKDFKINLSHARAGSINSKEPEELTIKRGFLCKTKNYQAICSLCSLCSTGTEQGKAGVRNE